MTFKISVSLIIVACSIFSTSDSFAGEPEHHPIVPGFQRFIESEEITDVERGMLLLNELNCNSCHDSNSVWSVAPKQAPILTGIGSRVLPEYFEPFLLDPHAVNPGTMMPNLLAGKPEPERKQIAESLAHFLASTGELVRQTPSSADTSEGEQLFHSIGCVACHDPQKEEVTIATSIPLGKLEDKYSLSALTNFIKNPSHTRPSGRMPQFNVTNDEARNLSLYLLRNVVVNSKVNVAYYHGRWETLPDFDSLEPISTEIATRFDVTSWDRDTHFGLVFKGFWTTSRDAKYKFRLSSDDGSRLKIDGETIVENDGIHPMVWKESEIDLKSGVHEIVVEFFENDGGEGLLVEVSGDGLEGVSLDSLLQATPEAAKPREEVSFQIDSAKAQLGKEYFQSLGCASCHELKLDGEQLVSSSPKKLHLTELDPAKGCASNAASSPLFGLSEDQVRCLTAAIEDLAQTRRSGNRKENGERADSASTTPEQLVHEKLLTHNCYACHNRQLADGTIRGGVVDVRGDSLEIYGRKNWFTGTQIEMGDEGQHPPSLTSIGSKLKPEWLNKVLADGIQDRPYMHTRMPMFGSENLGTLANDLIKLDRLTDIVNVVQTEDERSVKAHGRFFAGDEALSCIKCHTFGKYQATGIQAIDLTTMTKRLERDWFQAYMLKPSKFRKGTRMPESWPSGKSFYPDILDGDVYKQIDAIWQFLSDGEEAAKPIGLVRTKLELKAVDAPKIYRNFIEGAGSRAIGVGYPEQVNIAFDAELCRLALVWQENFIDASRHWTGRGQGFEPPLGENILTLPGSIVFSTSAGPDGFSADSAPRPKFNGYRFNKDRRPTFAYQLGDVTIEDQPIPYTLDDRPLLKRKFKITSTSTKKLYYLAAQGESVEINNGTANIDDKWQTSFGQNPKATIGNTSNGSVIVEIDLSAGPVELEQTYVW